MTRSAIELNESNFAQEVLDALDPVLVHFWASWSARCKTMTPMLAAVAEDEAVPVKVARVNVERHEALAEQYGVRAVPTILIFSQGGLQDQIIGCATEQEVREKLERFKLIPASQLAAEKRA
jgi:thioredoxin